jgi:hypothetical protein
LLTYPLRKRENNCIVEFNAFFIVCGFHFACRSCSDCRLLTIDASCRCGIVVVAIRAYVHKRNFVIGVLLVRFHIPWSKTSLDMMQSNISFDVMQNLWQAPYGMDKHPHHSALCYQHLKLAGPHCRRCQHVFEWRRGCCHPLVHASKAAGPDQSLQQYQTSWYL